MSLRQSKLIHRKDARVRYVGSSSSTSKFIGANEPDDMPSSSSYPPLLDPFDESIRGPVFPLTFSLAAYAIAITTVVAISILLLVLSIHDNVRVNRIGYDLRLVTYLDVTLAENATALANRLNAANAELDVIQSDIVLLQENVTSLQARIDDINCTGIRDIDGVVVADFFVVSGIEEFIVIENSTTRDNEIIINASPLQLLLDAQSQELIMLNALLISVEQQIATLNEETIKSIDSSTVVAASNNIDFIGQCNATITADPINHAVIVDACLIQSLIEQLFQEIFANFQESLQKVAMLQADIAEINAKVTTIEGIIQNITLLALRTVNDRVPDGAGTINIVPENEYIDIGTVGTDGIVVTNNGVRSINDVTSFPYGGNQGDYQVVAGDGVAVTNTAPGTITIDNTVSPKKCSLFQSTLNVITTALPGLPPVGGAIQRYMDVGFDNANTLAVPAGCTPTDGVFRRYGIATPNIEIINEICIPEGKWILSFNADLLTFPFGAATTTYMSLVIGLGSIGTAVSVTPLTTWDLYTRSGVPVEGKLNSEFTLVAGPNFCLNVTWYAANVINVGPTTVMTRWSLTELN